jgi:hypothetical protein
MAQFYVSVKNKIKVLSVRNSADNTFKVQFAGGTGGLASGAYVRKIGDTMTGRLTINPVRDSTALDAKGDIVIKSGCKIYFDGV